MGWFSKLFKKVFSWIVVIVAIVAVVVVTVISCGAGLAAMSGFLAAGMAGLSSATFLGLSLGQCMLIVMVAGFSAICLLHIAVSLVGGATDILLMSDTSPVEVDTPETASYEPTGAGSFVKRLSITDETIDEVEFVLRTGAEADDVVISSEVEDGVYAGWLSAQAVALAAQADLLVRTGQAEELRASLATTISQLAAAEEELIASVQELEEAEQDSAEARARLVEVQQRLVEARDLEAELRAANAAVHAQLDAASARETALLNQLAESRADALSLGTTLASLSEELASQVETSEALSAQLDELESRNRAYQDALANLNADSLASQERWAAALEAQQRLTAEAQSSVVALQAQISDLQTTLAATAESDAAERDRLNQQISALSQALDAANELRQTAERGLEYANSELVSLRALAASLTEQLEESDQSALVTELRNAIADYDAILNEVQREARAKEALSQSLSSQLSAATNRIAQLMAQAEVDEQTRTLLANQVNAAAQAASTYQATLEQKDMENAALRDYIANLNKQLARLSEVTTRVHNNTQEHDKGVVTAIAVTALAVAATVLDE